MIARELVAYRFRFDPADRQRARGILGDLRAAWDEASNDHVMGHLRLETTTSKLTGSDGAGAQWWLDRAYERLLERRADMAAEGHRLVIEGERRAQLSQARKDGRATQAENATAESASRKRQWLNFRAEVRNDRRFRDRPPRDWNTEADRRLVDWLRKRGVGVSAKTITNQRSREGWLE